jgi:ureidoglycolate hydrolase
VRFAQLGGERPRGRIWHHRQLALQKRSEIFVVLERVGSAPASSQHAHDQTVRVLTQTADGYDPVGGA